MTPEQIETTLNSYALALTGFGIEGENLEEKPLGNLEALKHIVWMCQETKNLVRGGETERAFRWLGFIQGVLWARGLYTINEMKEHNRG